MILKEIVDGSDNIVFFGGAGVSTESGIPDYRSAGGLYSKKYKEKYSPETIMSHDFLMTKPELYYEYFKEHRLFSDEKPNAAHIKLAELEAQGKLKAVITQNIDGLHQAAGSKNVLELHGSTKRFYCACCGKKHPKTCLEQESLVPKCGCGGMIRPDVVHFGEQLDDDTVKKAVYFIQNADVFIIGGTSLAVYPAAGLIDLYHGDKLVLINKDATSRDAVADLIIREPIGETLSGI